MALEAVVLPQSLFEYTVKEWRAAGEGERHELGGIIEDENGDPDCSSVQQSLSWNANSLPHKAGEDAVEVATRKKRRRSRCIADKEKVESQRMTHIAVERNRRRQMNEYLAVLRSLMPSSYVQKGDQASIVAGAVYYVRELEQLLQTLQAQRRLQQQPDTASAAAATASFADFFTFPQFSPYPYNGRGSNSDTNSDMTANQTLADIASIEVTLAEGHAHLKLLSAPEAAAQAGDGAAELATGAAASQRDLRPRDGHVLLQSQGRLSSCLPTRVCLCSSAAVSSEFASADELATTVNQMLGRMEEEEKFGFPRFECKQTNKKSGS